MSEWWTYRVSSFLLFSPRTYFRLHELYNVEIWPAQLVALALGIVMLILLRHPGRWPDRLVVLIVACSWTWVAWAFHLRRYASINWAATYFAAAFLAEAVLLLWTGVIRARVTFDSASSLTQRPGFYVIVFALVMPALGPLVGRSWVQSEVFGVAPDPTVVATLGVLLLARQRRRFVLALIPLLWCALSGAFQWAMRTPDAPVMPLIALAFVVAAATGRATSQRVAVG
jgi:hypothetical protein